jgi:FixJ family two-component response regulator
MTGRFCKRIYVLEREPQFRTLLETALRAAKVSTCGFSGHQECLARLATKPCDVLIVDLDDRTPDGLHVLEQARRIAPWIASLAIVEHAAIRCAIKAIKAGADDCLDRPVQQDRLLTAVEAQLARVDMSARRPRALTEMEVHILHRILAGQTSCGMAAEFHRSKRTMDVHRKNIMRKLQATGLVDLIKRALEMGFGEQPERPPDEPDPQPHNDAEENAAVGTDPATGA